MTREDGGLPHICLEPRMVGDRVGGEDLGAPGWETWDQGLARRLGGAREQEIMGKKRRGGAEMSAVSKGVRVSACTCACTCVSMLMHMHMCVMQADRREGTSVPGCMTATTITGQKALVF